MRRIECWRCRIDGFVMLPNTRVYGAGMPLAASILEGSKMDNANNQLELEIKDGGSIPPIKESLACDLWKDSHLLSDNISQTADSLPKLELTDHIDPPQSAIGKGEDEKNLDAEFANQKSDPQSFDQKGADGLTAVAKSTDE